MNSRWQYRVPILVSLGGFLVVLGFHLALRLDVVPPSIWIYWAGLLLTVIPGFVSGSRRAAIFGLTLFAFLQCFAYTFSAPYGLVYLRDSIYNMQLARLIVQEGAWYPGSGTGLAFSYSFHPGSNLFHASLSMTSGLDLNNSYLLATALLRFAVLPLALARILGTFVDARATYVAVALFLGTPSNLFNIPVQQEFAYVFGVLGIYAAILPALIGGGFRFVASTRVAAIGFLATVVVSHHFTSYVFLFIITALAVLSFVVARRPAPDAAGTRFVVLETFKGLRYAAVAFAFLFLIWSILVSGPLDLTWLDFGATSIERIFAPGTRLGGVEASGVQPGFTYSRVELFLIGASLGILSIASFAGAFVLARRSDRWPPTRRPVAKVLMPLFLVALGPVVVSAPFVVTSGLFIPLRVLEFSILGLAPLVAVMLGYLSLRRSVRSIAATAILASVVILGGSLVQPGSPRLYYIPADAVFSDIPMHLTTDLIRAATWAQSHVSSRARVYGDELVVDAFGGYGAFHAMPEHWPAYPLFNATGLSGDMTLQFGLAPGDMIVTHVFMTQSISFAAFRTTPLEPSKIDKFSQNATFAQIYADASVTIYLWQG